MIRKDDLHEPFEWLDFPAINTGVFMEKGLPPPPIFIAGNPDHLNIQGPFAADGVAGAFCRLKVIFLLDHQNVSVGSLSMKQVQGLLSALSTKHTLWKIHGSPPPYSPRPPLFSNFPGHPLGWCGLP